MDAVRNYPKNIGTERFVVAVDRQEKRSFAEHEMALAEAERLRKLFPKVLVEVRDNQGAAVHGAQDGKASA